MAAADPCAPQVQACAVRVTLLEDDGSPDVGSSSRLVTDALISMTVTPVYADADEIEVKNACGVVCVSSIGDDTFKRLDVALTICTPNPRLAAMLSGGTILTNGSAIGMAYPATGTATAASVAIELWAKRIDPATGDLDSTYPYNHWLFPKVKNLRIGEATFENDAFTFPFSGRGFGNDQWLDGVGANEWPYPAVASDRPGQFIPADNLPTPSCNYVETTGS